MIFINCPIHGKELWYKYLEFEDIGDSKRFTLHLKCGVPGCEYMDKLNYLKAKEDD